MKNISLSGFAGFLMILLVALIFGLSIPIMPYKFTLLFAIIVLGVVGFLVAVALPAKAAAPYRLIYTIFVIAVMAKFLWPNFAYIPVPALPSKNPQRWIWAFCLLYWIYSLLTNPILRQRLAQRIALSRLAWVILGLFAWRLLSVGFSERPLVSTYTMAIELFEYLPAFLFAVTWVRDESDAAKLAKALLATAIVVFLITAGELLTQQNLFILFAPHDISNEDFLLAVLEAKTRGGAYRAQASFNHPLLMAQFAVSVLPLALLGLLTFDRFRGRATAIGALGSLLIVLWASRTRTAIVVAGVVIASVIIMLAFKAVRDRSGGVNRPLLGGLSLIGGFLVLGVAIGVLLLLTAGRSVEESSSSMARVTMLELAYKAMIEEPIFGYGPGVGNFHAALRSSNGLTSLDSYFLTQLLESGIPAFLLYITILIIGSAAFLRQTLFSRNPKYDLSSAMWSLSIIAFGISSLVLSTPHNMPLLYLCLGVVTALKFRNHEQNTVESVEFYNSPNEVRAHTFPVSSKSL